MYLSTFTLLLVSISLVTSSPLAAPIDALVGFAAGTTGGGFGNGTTVTSCSALTNATKKGGVIKIKGNLKGCGITKLASNTSVLGIGSDAGIEEGGFKIKNVENVIIRNLKFHKALKKMDLIAIDRAKWIWIDHNDFSNAGITGDKDFYDGLLDATHGADFLTFSWNKFHDHWKASLIGHSDSNAAEDTGKLHVTFHHNHWTRVNSRLPSIRFGTAHVYSSCYVDNGVSGINSRMGAHVLVEGNEFKGTRRSIVTDLDSRKKGFAVERDNIFDTVSLPEITQKGSLDVPYEYVVDGAEGICATVEKNAGVGVVTF